MHLVHINKHTYTHVHTYTYIHKLRFSFTSVNLWLNVFTLRESSSSGDSIVIFVNFIFCLHFHIWFCCMNLSAVRFGIIRTLATNKLICVAQTNWCCWQPSCHLLSRVWCSRSAILNFTKTCSSMMSAISHRNSELFVLCSFAALTGKSQSHVMSNRTVSILWSISQHHCSGSSGDTLPFDKQSLLCRLFTLLNSLATPVWSDLWGYNLEHED